MSNELVIRENDKCKCGGHFTVEVYSCDGSYINIRLKCRKCYHTKDIKRAYADRATRIERRYNADTKAT